MAGKSPKSIREQTQRFEQAAKELECDEDPAHFDAALKKVARHKPAKDSEDGAPKQSGAQPSKEGR
jgi:hypothetical protein